jgi:hypothetical protein
LGGKLAAFFIFAASELGCLVGDRRVRFAGRAIECASQYALAALGDSRWFSIVVTAIGWRIHPRLGLVNSAGDHRFGVSHECLERCAAVSYSRHCFIQSF